MDRNTYPALLAEKLKTNNITQRELAERMGIDPSAISRWLSTKRKTLVIPSQQSIADIEYAISAILAKRVKSRSVSV